MFKLYTDCPCLSYEFLKNMFIPVGVSILAKLANDTWGRSPNLV